MEQSRESMQKAVTPEVSAMLTKLTEGTAKGRQRLARCLMREAIRLVVGDVELTPQALVEATMTLMSEAVDGMRRDKLIKLVAPPPAPSNPSAAN